MPTGIGTILLHISPTCSHTWPSTVNWCYLLSCTSKTSKTNNRGNWVPAVAVSLGTSPSLETSLVNLGNVIAVNHLQVWDPMPKLSLEHQCPWTYYTYWGAWYHRAHRATTLSWSRSNIPISSVVEMLASAFIRSASVARGARWGTVLLCLLFDETPWTHTTPQCPISNFGLDRSMMMTPLSQ